MRPGGRGQPTVEFVEAAVGPHRRDRGRKQLLLGRRIVHVVAGDQRQAPLGGEPGERVVEVRVERVAVIDEFDVHRIATKQCGQLIELARGRFDTGRPAPAERPAHGALSAPRQHRPFAARRRGERFEFVDRAPLLGSLKLGVRDGAGESVIALLAAAQHEQVGAHRIGFALLRLGELKRELGPEYGLQLQRFGRLGKPDDAVEAVVVGDCERVQPEPLGLLGERFG